MHISYFNKSVSIASLLLVASIVGVRAKDPKAGGTSVVPRTDVESTAYGSSWQNGTNPPSKGPLFTKFDSMTLNGSDTNKTSKGISTRDDQADYRVVDVTSASSITLSWTNNSYFLPLTHNATVSWVDYPTSTTRERELRLTVTNTSTFTLTFGTINGKTIKWDETGSETAPTLAGSSRTRFVFTWDRTNFWGDCDLSDGDSMTIGSGTDRSVLITAPAGDVFFVKGTTASPDTSTNPLVKVVRTMNVQDAQAFGDAGENMAAFSAIGYGVITNQLQTVGVFGGAVNLSTNYSGTTPNDALGVYGAGRINNTGTGRGIGGFFIGRRDSSAAKQNALQALSYNGAGVNEGYSSITAPTTMGLFLFAGGDADSVAAMAIGNPTSAAKQFDFGLAFSGQVNNGHTGAVALVSIVDDSVNAHSILIRGTHSEAAIAVGASSGKVVIGSTNAAGVGSRLDIVGPNGDSTLVSFGNPNYVKDFGFNWVNSQGTATIGIADTDGFLTGAAQGDMTISSRTTGKAVHIGGTTPVLTVTRANTFGAFGVTPVAQQDTDAITALKSYGLLAPSGTEGIIVYDDMFNAVSGSFGWVSSASGTGATFIGTAGTSAHPGINQFVSGTTSNGISGVRVVANAILFGGGQQIFTTSVRIPTLSDGSDTFTDVAGFYDAGSAVGDCVDGAYFIYSSSGTYYTNVTKWSGMVSSNSVRVEIPSNITVTANQFYKLQVVVNAAGTQADFYVDDVLIGSNATTVPSGTGRGTSIAYKQEKQLGLNSRNFEADYAKWYFKPTTAR